MKALLPGITVLVCTYNGARNLPATLGHLAAQQCDPGLAWEIILVDNASTDDTGAVAARQRDELAFRVPFRIIREEKPGKDNAIDTGIGQSRYQYLLICDDDNWLAPNYVQRAFALMAANPSIGMLGGRGIPVFEQAPPAWFERFENYFAVGRQNPESGEVTTGKGFLWGAGAVLNLEAYHLLRAAGFQRVITFARYPRIARGEDVELCLAVKLTGYKIWYDESLVLRHYISAQKSTWAYVTRLAREGAYIGVILGIYQQVIRQRTGDRPAGWLETACRRLGSVRELKNIAGLVCKPGREGSREYLARLFSFHYLVALCAMNREYDRVRERVGRLAERLPRSQGLPAQRVG